MTERERERVSEESGENEGRQVEFRDAMCRKAGRAWRKKENAGRPRHETTFIIFPQQWTIITINRDPPRLSPPRIGLALPDS